MTHREDITLCVPVSGRNARLYGALEVGGLIGFFANLLLVRNVVDGKTPVRTYFNRLRNNFLDDLNHEAYPFAKLIGELPGVPTGSFMDAAVFYNYRNYGYNQERDHADGPAGELSGKQSFLKMPLAFCLTVTEYRNCLHLQLMFNENAFGAADRLRVADRYFAMLDQIVRTPGALVEDLGNHPPAGPAMRTLNQPFLNF
jgi:non-ribosomal peptide synthetase component F